MPVVHRAAGVLVLVGQAALAQAPADSTAARLKERVRAASPVLATRSAQTDLALARRDATGFLPAAVASGEVEEVPSFLNVAGAGSMRVDLSRELTPRARLRAERAVAERDVDRARIEAEISGRALDAIVDQLVVKSASATAIASRLQSEDSLLRGAEEALRSRFAVGDARYVDVLRLRTERLRVETEIHRSRAESRVARQQLLRLAAHRDTLEIALLVTDLTRRTSAAYLTGMLPALPRLDSLLAASGALRLAALNLERAESGRALALLEGKPSISASLGLQRFAREGSGRGLGLTAGISLPLQFTARRSIDARLVIAEREVALARAEQSATSARVTSAVASAADRYEMARVQMAAFDAALLRGARDEREAALAAYRTGGLTLIELLDFERALAQAEVARIRSQADAADALLDLITSALGMESTHVRN